MVDNSIHAVTMDCMPFIQFPYIEVPKELLPIVGAPTPGTRAYRREGTFKECGEWFETLAEHYKGDVGLSSGGVIMFVPVSRAGVHKRIANKLVQFFRHLDEWKLNERHLTECSPKYTTVNYNLTIVFRNVVPPAWTPSGTWLAVKRARLEIPTRSPSQPRPVIPEWNAAE